MMAGGNPEEGRQDNDWYATPPEVTQSLLAAYGSFLEGYSGLYVEPCCGDGAISKILAQRLPEARVASFDLVYRGYGFQADIFSRVIQRDDEVDVVITNPPFNIAEKIVRHVMGNWKPKVMALLLKSTFFHAAERAALFEEYPPAHIFALPWRPDFLGKGRPTMECSWFVWDVNQPKGICYYSVAPNLNPKRRQR